MAKKIEPAEEFQRGDIVVVKLHSHMRGKVIELRGPLGPNGEQVYRIRLGKDSGRRQLEVLPQQLRLLRRAEPAAGSPRGLARRRHFGPAPVAACRRGSCVRGEPSSGSGGRGTRCTAGRRSRASLLVPPLRGTSVRVPAYRPQGRVRPPITRPPAADPIPPASGFVAVRLSPIRARLVR